MKRIAMRAAIAVCVFALGTLAMAPPLRAHITKMIRQSVQTFAPGEETQAEVTLPGMRVSALQLGVYDSGERAQSEVARLQREGVLCVIWQREQMRLIGDAQMAKNALTDQAAQGRDVWIIEEEMPEVVLRVSAKAHEVAEVEELLCLPDDLLRRLCVGGEELGALAEEAERKASRALKAHPDHLLYTQLAQSLVNWCRLMREVEANYPAQTATAYARATLCTLCIKLRQALIDGGDQSAASTASAQRTPSTAADVMPPA